MHCSRLLGVLSLCCFLACGHGDSVLHGILQGGTSRTVEGLLRSANLVSKVLMGTLGLASDNGTPRKMSVFVASLPRTGTASIEMALETLGYNCLHGVEIAPHDQIIDDVYNGRKSVDDLMRYMEGKGYDVGGMDLMGQFWEWAKDKPDVKVVLPVRDAESWARSWHVIRPGLGTLNGPPFTFSPQMRRILQLVNDCMNVSGIMTDDSIEVNMKKVHQEYHDRVIKTIPADRLLVFDLRQGWAPLCNFLGKPVPDGPFPHVHDSQTIKVAISFLDVTALLWPLYLVLPALLLVCCCMPRWKTKKE